MKLIFSNKSPYEKKNEVSSSEFGQRRTGCWAYVTAVHSDSLTVDAENSNGFKFHYVPVASSEWVNKDGGSGERNLPPVGSRVFILMPTGTVQGGFVLCSGFSFNSANEKAEFTASSDEDVESFNLLKKKISNSGWTFEENLNNGNLSFASKSKQIKIEAFNEDDDEKEQKKGFQLTAFDSVIKWDDEGVILTEKNGNKITLNDSGITVEDKNGGKITMTDGGITVEDSNGNKIETSSSSVKINGSLEVLK